MNELNIPGSQSTPSVSSNLALGQLSLQGDSYPENSFEFFTTVISWIEDFLTQKTEPLTLELGLIYMNTSSVKAMMDIFDLLEDAHKNERPVSVSWHYDPRNERVVELADEFREDCSFPFEIIAIA